MATGCTDAAMTADRINLVDKNNARRVFPRIRKHVAHTGCADTHKHFNKIRTGNCEERDTCFPGDSPREKWVSGIPGYYLPSSDEDATILGDAQWQWLDRILREPAELRVVVSSIQVVSNDHRFEKWGNFPAERRRLFERIAATNANGVVFLSGDRHSGEISRLDPDRAKIGSFVDVGYPVYDVTSSALTNSAPTVPGESEGSSRSGFVQYSDERNRHRIGSHIRYNNFGTLTVDWDAAGGALLTMRLYTDRGRELIREVVRIDSLRSRTAR